MKRVIGYIVVSLSMHGIVASDKSCYDQGSAAVVIVSKPQEAKAVTSCDHCTLLHAELAKTQALVMQLQADHNRTSGYVADLWAHYRQHKKK